eukprot:SAG31_NODE_2277_length_6027_cov_4.019062_3_plen_244_part_00
MKLHSPTMMGLFVALATAAIAKISGLSEYVCQSNTSTHGSIAVKNAAPKKGARFLNQPRACPSIDMWEMQQKRVHKPGNVPALTVAAGQILPPHPQDQVVGVVLLHRSYRCVEVPAGDEPKELLVVSDEGWLEVGASRQRARQPSEACRVRAPGLVQRGHGPIVLAHERDGPFPTGGGDGEEVRQAQCRPVELVVELPAEQPRVGSPRQHLRRRNPLALRRKLWGPHVVIEPVMVEPGGAEIQ